MPLDPAGRTAADAPREEPRLPTRFRPLWARRVIRVLQAVAVVAFAVGAWSLPSGPGGYGTGDRVAAVATGLLMAAALQGFARVRVEADADGLTVVNLLRTRRLAWAQVLAVRLPPGDPWLVLDLSDGTALPAMGVQGSDGDFARAQAQTLARLVEQRSASSPEP